jgi:hypothetical protein
MGSWVDPAGLQVDQRERHVVLSRPTRGHNLDVEQLTRLGCLAVALLHRVVGVRLIDARTALALAAGVPEQEFRRHYAAAPHQPGDVLKALRSTTYCGRERGTGVE